MSASDPVVVANPAAPAAATAADPAQQADSWWNRLDRGLEWAGERLNPILVKEARQALKSKQFVITFALVLLCAWIWSISGAVFMGPEVFYRPSGQEYFLGYFFILSFPLLVIVPFGAYQSLSGEREDRTYELLSITTLRPWQIISGKLGSACVQMLVYLSAVSPCLAFTYMLRGIDILKILFMIGYVVLASVAFSAVALLLATITSEKHWQIVMSVVLILALVYGFFGGMVLATELAWQVWAFDDNWFWIFNAAMMTAYLSYFALVTTAAASQLTFASDNRSTRLRVIMLVQQGLWTAWMGGVWIYAARDGRVDGEMFYVFAVVAMIHWWVMGAFMTGDSPVLSRRVQRSLPTSFFGRLFLTWFNPGPGTGYMFAVANLLTVWLLVFFAVIAIDQFGFGGLRFVGAPGIPGVRPALEKLVVFTTLAVAYPIAYLGIGRFLVALARRTQPAGVLLPVLINFLLLLAGTGIPLVIQYSADRPQTSYTLLQFSNPFWTLAEVSDTMAFAGEVLVIVLSLAVAAFLFNLPAVLREVRFTRTAKPRRVAEEDAELQVRLHPTEPVKKSPWDEAPV